MKIKINTATKIETALQSSTDIITASLQYNMLIYSIILYQVSDAVMAGVGRMSAASKACQQLVKHVSS
jgi:hypothetical protein